MCLRTLKREAKPLLPQSAKADFALLIVAATSVAGSRDERLNVRIVHVRAVGTALQVFGFPGQTACRNLHVGAVLNLFHTPVPYPDDAV